MPTWWPLDSHNTAAPTQLPQRQSTPAQRRYLRAGAIQYSPESTGTRVHDCGQSDLVQIADRVGFWELCDPLLRNRYFKWRGMESKVSQFDKLCRLGIE